MGLLIYNTLTKNKEIFEPLEEGKISIYVCGPTVYDSCHIGHARSVVVFDVIVKYLKAMGYKVKYIRNFTDVDDKIIKRANELGISSKELADKYIDEFHEDMDSLNVARASIEPKVTDHIDSIINMIKCLIDKKAAYESEGDVFFSVESFKNYGRLSGRKLEDMEAGHRIEINEQKKNPFDFVLWKTAKPGEPFWGSPWGDGRPGWHIECSAMSAKYLGETFDIHGGGKDLIFPHHENEIAQSEAASGKTFAKYWVHNGFVNIDQEKMSKSLGNFKMIKDVLKTYNSDIIRLFLLSNHYRSPIDFNDKQMNEAMSGVEKIYRTLQRIGKRAESNICRKDNKFEKKGLFEKFVQCMDDDFNTAKGIGILFEAVKKINRIMDAENKIDNAGQLLSAYYCEISDICSILGICKDDPDNYFNKKKDSVIVNSSVDAEKIDAMVKARECARKDKNWEKADLIRKELEELKVKLEDRADGTRWSFED